MSPTDSPSSPIEVVGVGAATWDDLWLVPEFSDKEGVTLALQHAQMGGGPVATALCVMADLGHSAALFDLLGDDHLGATIREDLTLRGVSPQGLRGQSGARSASAVVMVRVTDGARQISYLPSSAEALQLDSSHHEMIRGARLLHINGRHEQASREAVRLARASEALISFDGGAGRYRDSIRDLVQQSQIRIVSLEFAHAFCQSEDLDEMIQCLLAEPAELVVITDGIRGSHVALPNGVRFHQPAYPANVVDTTGCGDVYHGAFLHGWLKDWSPQACADFASRLAAQNAEGLGGRWVCQS